MQNMIKEFKDFINKGDVVMVAVGLVIALYFKDIVDAIIAGLITPMIAAVFGESSLAGVGTFSINGADFSIGLVLQAAVDFLLVALVLFLVVKAYNRWKAESPEEEAGPTEVELLTEIRDSLRNR